jgi:regulatory protein
MNKKEQLEQLRASMQAINGLKSTAYSLADEDETYQRTRRRTAIKQESKKSKSGSALHFSKKEQAPEEIARQYALDCLSRREYGTQELLNKMLAKGHESNVSEQVLKDLNDEDLLSDVRFAEAMLSHGAFKGQGPRKIRNDLAKKSLPAQYINAAFEACEIDWFQLAKEVRVKKYGNSHPEEWKVKAKQMRFMQTRGFEIEHINHSFTSNG